MTSLVMGSCDNCNTVDSSFSPGDSDIIILKYLVINHNGGAGEMV